jgi:phosphoribosylaminoimidazole-succinocarboxamide synthase
MRRRIKENDKFPNPIITPTQKRITENDADISQGDILAKELTRSL